MLRDHMVVIDISDEIDGLVRPVIDVEKGIPGGVLVPFEDRVIHARPILVKVLRSGFMMHSRQFISDLLE